MECTRNEQLVTQTYEILVYLNCPQATIPPYARLRVALLGSAWLPTSVGMLLWSGYALLAAGGYVLFLPAASCLVLLAVAWDYLVLIPYYILCMLVAVLARSSELLIRLLITLSRLSASPRLDQMRVGWTWYVNQVTEDHRLIYEFCVNIFLWTPLCVQSFGCWYRALDGWCQVVVHMNDVIVI